MKIQNPKLRLERLERLDLSNDWRGLTSPCHSERGVSLYLALVTMSAILALTLGISAISFGQAQTVKEMGNSVFSFYAAESGIERALFEMSRGAAAPNHYAGSFENGASYAADIIGPGEIKSVGSYKNTKRAIQIAR